MKKIMLAGSILLAGLQLFAQPQKPPPAEDRWKHDSQLIAEKSGLASSKVDKLKPAFLSFYTEIDHVMKEGKSVRPPREQVEPIMKKRNEAIRKLLNEADFNSFLKIEKQLGPPPPKGDRPPPEQKQ